MDDDKSDLLAYFHKECLYIKMKRNISHSTFQNYNASLVNAVKYQNRITMHVRLETYFRKYFDITNQ